MTLVFEKNICGFKSEHFIVHRPLFRIGDKLFIMLIIVISMLNEIFEYKSSMFITLVPYFKTQDVHLCMIIISSEMSINKSLLLEID